MHHICHRWRREIKLIRLSHHWELLKRWVIIYCQIEREIILDNSSSSSSSSTHQWECIPLWVCNLLDLWIQLEQVDSNYVLSHWFKYCLICIEFITPKILRIYLKILKRVRILIDIEKSTWILQLIQLIYSSVFGIVCWW